MRKSLVVILISVLTIVISGCQDTVAGKTDSPAKAPPAVTTIPETPEPNLTQEESVSQPDSVSEDKIFNFTCDEFIENFNKLSVIPGTLKYSKDMDGVPTYLIEYNKETPPEGSDDIYIQTIQNENDDLTGIILMGTENSMLYKMYAHSILLSVGVDEDTSAEITVAKFNTSVLELETNGYSIKFLYDSVENKSFFLLAPL